MATYTGRGGLSFVGSIARGLSKFARTKTGGLSFKGSVTNDWVNQWSQSVIRIIEPATVINQNCYIQGLEWVEDRGNPMIDGSELRMTVNGVNVNLLCVLSLTQTWVVKFSQPIQVGSLVVTRLDGGVLLVWKA